MEKLICSSCGSDELKEKENGIYVCANCNAKYVLGLNAKDSEYIISHTEKALWEQTVAKIEKVLFNLKKAAQEEYIDDRALVSWCRELKKLIPDHFLANFYEKAIGSDKRALAEYIGSINTEDHYEDIPEILRFAIKLISGETLLALNNIISRAYENRDVVEYTKWNEILQVEQKKVDELVYDVTKRRDVFVAYKSEDMKEVERLVDKLENEEGLECFVASRNLQHGRISDYDKKLEQAMDSCKAVVFVSSRMSRRTGDARTKELKYIKEKDIENAPAEYRARNEYIKIPKKYKKPRVEYVVEPYAKITAEEYVKEFFDGYERVTKPNYAAVARSLFEQFDVPIEAEEVPQTAPVPEENNVKYCVGCGKRNTQDAKFCSACGTTEFVDSYEKYIEIKTERELRAKFEKEYAAKLEAERNAKEQAERDAKTEELRKKAEELERQKRETEERAAKLDAREKEIERKLQEERARKEREESERKDLERKERENAEKKQAEAQEWFKKGVEYANKNNMPKR